jgi:hypothetical protein
MQPDSPFQVSDSIPVDRESGWQNQKFMLHIGVGGIDPHLSAGSREEEGDCTLFETIVHNPSRS